MTQYTYLGVEVNAQNTQETEIDHCTLSWRLNSLPESAKLLYIYNLLYGAETWSLTTKIKSRIQVAEMRILRLIRCRVRWYGHVKRMNEGRLPRKYLDWQLAGKRTVGKPRKRRKEGVDEALRRRGTSLIEVEEGRDFDDRDDWRELRRMLPTLW